VEAPVDAGQGPNAEEGLTLIKAFMKIKSPQRRRRILDLVEKAVAAED
jgi:hypothetical protein